MGRPSQAEEVVKTSGADAVMKSHPPDEVMICKPLSR